MHYVLTVLAFLDCQYTKIRQTLLYTCSTGPCRVNVACYSAATYMSTHGPILIYGYMQTLNLRKLFWPTPLHSMCGSVTCLPGFVSGVVHVTYYSQHAAHSVNMAHQQLSREERTHVAGLLSTGIAFDDVLDRTAKQWQLAFVKASSHQQTRPKKHSMRLQHCARAARLCQRCWQCCCMGWSEPARW